MLFNTLFTVLFYLPLCLIIYKLLPASSRLSSKQTPKPLSLLQCRNFLQEDDISKIRHEFDQAIQRFINTPNSLINMPKMEILKIYYWLKQLFWISCCSLILNIDFVVSYYVVMNLRLDNIQVCRMTMITHSHIIPMTFMFYLFIFWKSIHWLNFFWF